MTVHLVVTQELPADCATVFDTVHDYRHRLEWDTLLRRAYTVDDAAPARSSVTYTMTFTVKPRWLAFVLEPVARALFRRETRRRLRALARRVQCTPVT